MRIDKKPGGVAVGETPKGDAQTQPKKNQQGQRIPFQPGGAAKPPMSLDQKLEAAKTELTQIMSATDGDGHWAKLDGTVPEWTTRPVGDLPGRFGPLSMDPAKGKMSPGSVEEAAVGLSAERAGVLPGPITREKTGQAEFVDATGAFWDVKSPVSPWAGARWVFDASHQVEKVKHDIMQDNSVLLNTSRLTQADRAQLLEVLRAQLTPAEIARVVVMSTAEVLVHD